MARIAVIGGGAAGLVTAWLLQSMHEVTVFEADTRLGGHAHTIAVELRGGIHTVDPGAHFFSERMHPHFVALLRTLGVPTIAYPPSATYHDRRDGWTICLPPHGGIARMAGLVDRRTLRAMLALRTLIRAAIPLVEGSRDDGLTLARFVDALALGELEREAFLFPYLGSYWGVTPQVVRDYSARNVTSYLVAMRPPVVTPRPFLRIVGGVGAYIDKLVASTTHALIERGADVRGISRDHDTHTIHLADRRVDGFDHVVLATSAERAAALLRELPGHEDAARTLAQVRYFDTEITVHGDRSFMPPNRAHWSVVNSVFDGSCAAITNWEPNNRGVELFRSWTTNVARPPARLHACIRYRHPHPDPAYFACQRELVRHQGAGGIWHAGMHVTGFDHHDGAIASARDVAAALAPERPRLAGT